MEKNTKYKCLNYWNERYKDEDHFEWFGEYEKFKSVINQKVSHIHKILTLGCGNSKMSEAMYIDGYYNIVNTDYSQVVIEMMQNKCKHLNKMSWLVMDINKLEFEPSTFECVLEKGTLDALLVDEKDPWNLSEENSIKIDKILESISKILKTDGVFISITFAQPHFRKPLYAKDKYNWSIELFTIGETFHYFVYVMTKGKKLNEDDKYFYCTNNLGLNNNYIKSANLKENELFEIQVEEIND